MIFLPKIFHLAVLDRPATADAEHSTTAENGITGHATHANAKRNLSVSHSGCPPSPRHVTTQRVAGHTRSVASRRCMRWRTILSSHSLTTTTCARPPARTHARTHSGLPASQPLSSIALRVRQTGNAKGGCCHMSPTGRTREPHIRTRAAHAHGAPGPPPRESRGRPQAGAGWRQLLLTTQRRG
jgi:hypothetical protein